MNVFEVECVSSSRLEHGGPQRMKGFPSRCEYVLSFIHENKAFFSVHKHPYSERSAFFVRPLRTIQVENLSTFHKGAAGATNIFLGNQSYFASVRAHHLLPWCFTLLSYRPFLEDYILSPVQRWQAQLRLCAGTSQICIMPKISCLVGIFSGCLRQMFK